MKQDLFIIYNNLNVMKKTYDSYYSTKEEQLSLTPTQLRNLEAQRVEERRDKIAEKSEKNRQRYGNYLGD